MAQIKVPPHNDEAEKSVLGALLIDKDAISIIAELIAPDDFYSASHGLLYSCMLELYEERKPIDVLTISSKLKKKKLHSQIPTSYVSELVNSVPTAANIEEYARLIKEAATRRALIAIGTEIAEKGFQDDRDVPAILNRAEGAIFSLSQGNIVKGFIPIKDTLAESFDRIDEIHKGGMRFRGIPTGFSDLDNLLSGFQQSNLIILAARPGQGKTAIVINMAQFISVNQKYPVGIFSLEMSKEELVDRLLIGQADVDAWKLKTGRLSEDDFSKLSEAMGRLADAPIFIDDTPGISISELRTKARRLQLETGIKLLIVDYLQLVDPGKRFENRVQEVSLVSQSLKNIARELKIPVLAVSQLSRAVEHRGEKRPQLADLRESGAIEQDADLVMFLYRTEEEYSPIMPIKLLIAKHRNGPVGEVDLLFRGDRIRFYSLESKRNVDILASP